MIVLIIFLSSFKHEHFPIVIPPCKSHIFRTANHLLLHYWNAVLIISGRIITTLTISNTDAYFILCKIWSKVGMKQKGFTLIELVIVIVVLGVIAVTAAPRFLSSQDDARDAVFVAVIAAFEDGMDLAMSKHKIEGEPESIEINGATISFMEMLIPQEYPTAKNSSDCAMLWNTVITGIESTDNQQVLSDDMVLAKHERSNSTVDLRGTCIYSMGDRRVEYLSGGGKLEES
ncbi:hypothetical protein VCR3J2_120097 [Vibrio coralliirubri]|nr:hypothetical protein VCR3J2_120097 [Vibrio coralliirubri]